jgi:6-phosphofructokinase 1
VPLPPWAMRAGARETIYFNPAEVNVAIVTCGGLCPGLNDVVQGLVNKLADYGVPDGHTLGIKCASDAQTLVLCHHAGAGQQHATLVLLRNAPRMRCSISVRPSCTRQRIAACRYGYRGFYDRDDKPAVLTRRSVDGIQLQGGTILGTSRGGADIKWGLQTLAAHAVQVSQANRPATRHRLHICPSVL